MNYGRLSPSIEYTLINYYDLPREAYHPERVVITESEHCDTAEKLTKIFKKVDTIITSDIDIRNLHCEFKELSKRVAYTKSIILVDSSDLKTLCSLLSSDPDLHLPSDDKMSLHDAFVSEVTHFCKFEEGEVKRLLRGKEGGNLTEKCVITGFGGVDFNVPSFATVDNRDRLIIADSNNNRVVVCEVDDEGRVTEVGAIDSFAGIGLYHPSSECS